MPFEGIRWWSSVPSRAPNRRGARGDRTIALLALVSPPSTPAPSCRGSPARTRTLRDEGDRR